MDEYKRRRRRSRAVMSMFLDSLGGSIDNVDVANFDSDGTDLKALIVGIDPVQDLHGYDNPWPAGGGGNYLSAPSAQTKTTGDVTVVTDGNGKYTVSTNGTISSDTYVEFDISPVMMPSTVYVYFGNPVSSGDVALYFYDENGTLIDYWYSWSVNRIVRGSAFDGETVAKISIWVKANADLSIYVLQPMVMTTDTETSFIPYSNICPITGHSSVNVIVSPTLNPLDGTITNIPLGGTYYGGQLDVLTGVLTVTHANISSYNGEAINEPWISSMDAYSPGATPTTGAQVVYPLATPTTIQLTGQQIATFLGTNHVWCDSGKIIHLEY